jgi:hypothetical protein
MCDAVKAAVAARENEINNVDPVQNQTWFPRSARDAFKLMKTENVCLWVLIMKMIIMYVEWSRTEVVGASVEVVITIS